MPYNYLSNMTPATWADAIISSFAETPNHEPHPALRAVVMEAISRAVTDEREACAKIAEGELMEVYEAGEERIVKSIAEQIRARGTP